MDEQIRSVFKANFNNDDYYDDVICSYNWELPDLRKYIDVINVEKFIQVCKNLPEDIIYYLLKECIVTINDLIKTQQLPETLLESVFANDDYVTIDECLLYQNVNTNLMQKYVDKLNWWLVSSNQLLDLKFLVENITRIHWDMLPNNPYMNPYINEGMISLFQQTNIWDSIGYTDIELEVLANYKKFFNEKSYESLIDARDITREDIDAVFALDNTC